jgi:hypothetical protein
VFERRVSGACAKIADLDVRENAAVGSQHARTKGRGREEVQLPSMMVITGDRRLTAVDRLEE